MRMRYVVSTSLLTLGLFSSAGCLSGLQNLRPEVKLQDEVYQFNEETRWSRTDLASQRTTREYRPTFIAAHRLWGRRVRIADADVTNIELGENGNSSSLVTYHWIDETSMELRETMVRQEWKEENDTHHVSAEEVIGGDDGLFAEVPNPSRPAASPRSAVSSL